MSNGFVKQHDKLDRLKSLHLLRNLSDQSVYIRLFVIWVLLQNHLLGGFADFEESVAGHFHNTLIGLGHELVELFDDCF